MNSLSTLQAGSFDSLGNIQKMYAVVTSISLTTMHGLGYRLVADYSAHGCLLVRRMLDIERQLLSDLTMTSLAQYFHEHIAMFEHRVAACRVT